MIRYVYLKMNNVNANLYYRMARFEEDPVMELWIGSKSGYSPGPRYSSYIEEGESFTLVSRNEVEGS